MGDSGLALGKVFLAMAGVAFIVYIPAWVMNEAVRRKGKLLKVVEIVVFLLGLGLFFVGLYVLIQGVAHLWKEDWQVTLASAGALAIVIYFWFFASDSSQPPSQ